MIKKTTRLSTLFIMWACMLVYGTEVFSNENTQSPYFMPVGADVNLPLQNTETFISIDGSIADISVKQTYTNEGSSPIEAVYVFPSSTRAAVYGLTITVDGRVTEAVIREKEAARAEYAQAKSEGKSAALLEQQKPNVFTMNVSNILPGDRIDVELRYTELVQVRDKVYELAYPMSIGGGYGERENSESNKTLADVQDAHSSTISIMLNSGIPVLDITSPSHEIDVMPISATSAEVTLVEQANITNRDFILRYTLAGDEIQSGMLLQEGEGEEENYFLLQMEPPARVEASSIASREYIFIIDTSGSMAGYPMDVSKALITELVEGLQPWEKFNVIFFAGDADVLSKHSLDANSGNIRKMKKMLGNFSGGGGTDLIKALKVADKIQIPDGYSRSVIAITDGYVRVGSETFRHIHENMGNANFFSFGIGNSVDRDLIEIIARAGYGESFVALNKKEAINQGRKMLDLIRYPLLTNINVEFEGFDAYDIQPFYVPDLFANKPLTITGKWQGDVKGKVIITGDTGAGEWTQSFDISSSQTLESRALEYLWARREVQQLEDLYSLEWNGDDEIKELITRLGLTHSLMTKFTSFLAIDPEIRAMEESQQVIQPQFVSSNGFVLPMLTMNTLASVLAIKNVKIEEGNVTRKVMADHVFDYIDQEWIDQNHSSSMSVIEISRTSKAFMALLKTAHWLDELSEGETYYITFGDVTLKIVSRHFETDIEMISPILTLLTKNA